MNEEIVIRPYVSGDLSACLEAFDSNLPPYFVPGERALFESFLSDYEKNPMNKEEKGYYFVICDGFQPVGCGGIALEHAKNTVSMTWGLVHKTYHKKGYGAKLLRFRLALSRVLFPDTQIILNTSNHTYQFFERHGFVTTEITENGFGPGLHRYDMVLQL